MISDAEWLRSGEWRKRDADPARARRIADRLDRLERDRKAAKGWFAEIRTSPFTSEHVLAIAQNALDYLEADHAAT